VGSMDGKVAVVSGASSGSGVGITRRFVQEGATVVMLARARPRLEEVAGEFGPSAVPIATDIGDPDSVRAAFEEVAARFGKIDVLVNHAAVYRPCAVELLDDDDITRQMATNFFGPVYASRAAVPLLRAAGGGDIVNTSSESTLHPFPMLSMYVASKAALEAFGKVLAQEVRDDDIRVTTVVQGTAAGAGGGATDYAWDPGHTAAAHALWTERGLLGEVLGRYNGQSVDDIGDVHVFIVTRPREQRLDVVHVRSF
jgi:NAD(P)-dependent dehydrogenase (short-subunit alcohol dehydrogenase family)